MGEVVAIGDVMLDSAEYLYTSNRQNPEHTAPLINASDIKRIITLGWAANLAANIKSLLWDVLLVWPINTDDEYASSVLNMMKEQWIRFHGLENTAPTITKKRIYLDKEYKWRIDNEKPIVIEHQYKEELLHVLEQEKPSYIVISDYAKWTIDQELMDMIRIFAADSNAKILVDTKPKHINMFSEAYLIKPNFKEFVAMIQKDIQNSDEDIEREGKIFVDKYKTNLVVTRSEKGASVITTEGIIYHLPTLTNDMDLVDVTGAGDTFLAGLTSGLVRWLPLQRAVELGNKASGIVVKQRWTSVVTLDQLGK